MSLSSSQRLLLAQAANGYDTTMTKQAFSNFVGENASAGKQWGAMGADLAASAFIPGYATVTSGIDAFNSFRKGNVLGGIGNLALAGVGLIPGVGGLTARGLKGVSRVAGKLPTLGKPIAGLAGLGLKGQKALNTGFNNFARTSIGKPVVGTGIGKKVTSTLGKHNIATPTIGNAAMGMQGSKFDANVAQKNQFADNVASTFQNLPGMAQSMGIGSGPMGNPANLRPPGAGSFSSPVSSTMSQSAYS